MYLTLAILFAPGPTRIDDAGAMPQVLIPAGACRLGSSAEEIGALANPAATAGEAPQADVRLSGFWMDAQEVSRAQYAAFLNAVRPRRIGAWLAPGISGLVQSDGAWEPADGADEEPVTGVTYAGATAYANYLGRGLPSEAQWEHAARGTAAGRLRNLLGGVWEWCRDVWAADSYATLTGLDPVRAGEGRERVIRGGSEGSEPVDRRPARRVGAPAGEGRDDLGFRTILTETAGPLMTTRSGLRYRVLREGDGPMPLHGQVVRAHYVGWLLDGTVFDSSRERGEPFEFEPGAGQVIAGWDEALREMTTGEIRLLVLPPELAYGDASPTPAIPNGSFLVFEVELVSIGR